MSFADLYSMYLYVREAYHKAFEKDKERKKLTRDRFNLLINELDSRVYGDSISSIKISDIIEE
jgi:hypothetical protein